MMLNDRNKTGHIIKMFPGARLFSLGVVLILLTPIVWGQFFTDHNLRSKAEKRILAPLPKFSGIVNDKNYSKNLASYLSDHIGFGLAINQFYQKFVFEYLDTVGVENISKGDDGFVFLTSHNPDKYNTIFSSLCLRDKNPAAVIDSATKIYNFVKAAGHRAIFAVPISKPALYPEKLPNDIGDVVKTSCKKYLTENNFLTNAQIKLSDKGIIMHYPVTQFLLHKNDEAFYPKENFHWNGASAHLFAKTFFEALSVDMSDNSDFSAGATLKKTYADLKSIGFNRTIKVWNYPYREYKVSANQRSKLASLKKYYERSRDVSFYTSLNPIQNKDAVVISNSYGAFTARDLAPGYKSLTQININHLQSGEQKAFFNHLFSLGKNMDFIFLFHDDAMAGSNALDKFSDTFD